MPVLMSILLLSKIFKHLSVSQVKGPTSWSVQRPIITIVFRLDGHLSKTHCSQGSLLASNREIQSR